ncbi:hypothetical protein COOONC_13837 [Cooperia oncophora]
MTSVGHTMRAERSWKIRSLSFRRFNRVAVCLLFYMWWMMCGVASSGGLSAPITMAMYDWTNEEAVLYNGIIQTISCAVSTFSYFIIGSTRVGLLDRRIHLFLGLAGFTFYHLCHYPMPFYDGPLHQEVYGQNFSCGFVRFEVGLLNICC